MKNQFSKALICGVIASSVILVNCQKSPNRPVTANKSGGSAKTDATGTNTDVTNVCVAEVLDAHKATQAVATKINDIIVDKSSSDKATTLKEKSKLTAGDQSSLKDLTTELTAKHEAVLAAFKKAKIEACLSEASKDKQRSAAPVLSTQSETQFYNALVENINKLLEEVVAEVKPVPKITTTAAVVSGDDLVQANFNLDSSDLGEALSKKSTESGQFLFNGKVEQDQQVRTEFNTNENVSGCGIITASKEAVEKDSLVTVTAVEPNKSLGNRKSYNVTAVVTGGDGFTLNCIIANKKELASEFKSIFKGMMTFQTAEEVAKNQEELKAQAKKIVDDALAKASQEQQPVQATPTAAASTVTAATAAPATATTPAATTPAVAADTATPKALPAVDPALTGSPQAQKQEGQADDAKSKAEPDAEAKPEAKAATKAEEKPAAAPAKAVAAVDSAELTKVKAELADVIKKNPAIHAEAVSDYSELQNILKTGMAMGLAEAQQKYKLSNQLLNDANAAYLALKSLSEAMAAKSSDEEIKSIQEKVQTTRVARENSQKALNAYKDSLRLSQQRGAK